VHPGQNKRRPLYKKPTQEVWGVGCVLPWVHYIVFFKVLDQRCDNKETPVNLISDIYEEFVVSDKWVLLGGDQDTQLSTGYFTGDFFCNYF